MQEALRRRAAIVERLVSKRKPTIGVTYGYVSVEELTLAGADFICSKPSDIP